MNVAPIETERFISILTARFRHYVDEIWGPIEGFGGPRMRPDPLPWREPDPSPWRELDIAYRVAVLADALELATEGMGTSLMRRFADEPEPLCWTRPPGRPRPPKGDEDDLDRAVLGAALVFVAEGIGSAGVADVAREAGHSMIG
jgi:hypothetical protein